MYCIKVMVRNTNQGNIIHLNTFFICPTNKDERNECKETNIQKPQTEAENYKYLSCHHEACVHPQTIRMWHWWRKWKNKLKRRIKRLFLIPLFCLGDEGQSEQKAAPLEQGLGLQIRFWAMPLSLPAHFCPAAKRQERKTMKSQTFLVCTH